MSLNPAEIGIVSEPPHPAAAGHYAPPSSDFADSLAKAARTAHGHAHKATPVKVAARQAVQNRLAAQPCVSTQPTKAGTATVKAQAQPAPSASGKSTMGQGQRSSRPTSAVPPAAAPRQPAPTAQTAAATPDADVDGSNLANDAEPADTVQTLSPTLPPEPAVPAAPNGAFGAFDSQTAGAEASSTESDSGPAAEPAGPIALAFATTPGAEPKSGADAAIDSTVTQNAPDAAPANAAAPVPVTSSAANASAPATAHQATEATPQSASPPAPPTVQLGVSLLRSALGLEQQVFTLSLRPDRLGGVDVRLEVDRQGRARATVTAEKDSTLTILRQDAHHLVDTLKQAGLDADASSISFSLKDPDQGKSPSGRERGTRPGSASGSEAEVPADTAEAPVIASNRLYDIKA